MLRHSVADALGSLGVVLAGGFVLLGGSDIVDPIVGLLIAVLVLASSWRLIKEPFDVLMEAAPADLDVDAMGAAICREDGVRSVHDLHVWTVTAGFGALAAHVVVARGCDRDLIRRRLELTLAERFGIEHTTLQMEEEADQGPAAGRERPARDEGRAQARLQGDARSRAGFGAWLASERCSRTAPSRWRSSSPSRRSARCSSPARRPAAGSRIRSSKPSSRSWTRCARRRAC